LINIAITFVIIILFIKKRKSFSNKEANRTLKNTMIVLELFFIAKIFLDSVVINILLPLEGNINNNNSLSVNTLNVNILSKFIYTEKTLTMATSFFTYLNLSLFRFCRLNDSKIVLSNKLFLLFLASLAFFSFVITYLLLSGIINKITDFIFFETAKIIFYISTFIEKKNSDELYSYEKGLLEVISDYKDLLHFFQTNFESKMTGLFLFEENLNNKNSFCEKNEFNKEQKFTKQQISPFHPNPNNYELVNIDLKINSHSNLGADLPGFSNIYETKNFTDKLKESILFHYNLQFNNFNHNKQNNHNQNPNEYYKKSAYDISTLISNNNNNNSNSYNQINNQINNNQNTNSQSSSLQVNSDKNNFNLENLKNSANSKFHHIKKQKNPLSNIIYNKSNNSDSALNANKNINDNYRPYYANEEKSNMLTERMKLNKSGKYVFPNFLSNRSSLNTSQNINFTPYNNYNNNHNMKTHENLSDSLNINLISNCTDNDHNLISPKKEEMNKNKRFSCNNLSVKRESRKNKYFNSFYLKAPKKNISNPTVHANLKLNNFYSTIIEKSAAQSSPFPGMIQGINKSRLNPEKYKLSSEEENSLCKKNLNFINIYNNSSSNNIFPKHETSDNSINYLDIHSPREAKVFLNKPQIPTTFTTVNNNNNNYNNNLINNVNFSSNNNIEKRKFSVYYLNSNKISSEDFKKYDLNNDSIEFKKTHIIREQSEEESSSLLAGY